MTVYLEIYVVGCLLKFWDHDGYPSTTPAIGLDLALRISPQAKFHYSSSDCGFDILLPEHSNNKFFIR